MGLFEGLYKILMRRNSVYVTFVIAGAFAGERAVDYGVQKLWENNNVGIPFLADPNLFEDNGLVVVVSWEKYENMMDKLGQNREEVPGYFSVGPEAGRVNAAKSTITPD